MGTLWQLSSLVNGAIGLARSRLFSNDAFLKFWAGQAISVLGSLVSRLALPFLVIYTLGATPMDVTWLRIAEILPGILVGLVAGVWVDRLPRRTVMIAVDTTRALLVGFIPLLIVLDRITIPAVVVLAALGSFVAAPFDSAYEALLPAIVEPGQVVEANAKMSAAFAVAETAAFGLAGFLFELLGGAITLSLDAVSFAISAITLWAIRSPAARAAPAAAEVSEPVEPFGRALARGARFLLQSPSLSRLATAALAQSLYFGISGAIYVLYVSRVLGVPPAVQGVLYAVGGLAALAAAHLAEPLAKRLGIEGAMVVSAAAAVVGTALLPLAGGALWMVVLFILGQQLFGDGGDTVFDIGLAAVRQGSTPNDILGRVGSIWLVLTSTGLLVGTLAGGVLVGMVGYRATLAGAVGVRVLVLALSWRVRGTTAA